jgi:hypothetical protein
VVGSLVGPLHPIRHTTAAWHSGWSSATHLASLQAALLRPEALLPEVVVVLCRRNTILRHDGCCLKCSCRCDRTERMAAGRRWAGGLGKSGLIGPIPRAHAVTCVDDVFAYL